MRGYLAILSFAAFSASQQIDVYSGKADGLSQHTIYMPKRAERSRSWSGEWWLHERWEGFQ